MYREKNASNSSVHLFHHLFLSLGKLHILYNGIQFNHRESSVVKPIILLVESYNRVLWLFCVLINCRLGEWDYGASSKIGELSIPCVAELRSSGFDFMTWLKKIRMFP